MNSAVDGATRYPGPIRTPAVHAHGLNAPSFTADSALADLLDCYPRELIDINHYTYDAAGQFSLSTGERGQLSGADLLSAIHKGELWVNLRGVETAWPELWHAATDAYDVISASYGGLDAVKRAGQLIISSPKTKVPYHFDAAGVVLFHMRGAKRMYVYPGDEAHLPEEAMERVVARQTTEELPYSLAFEQDAQSFDLMPGEALAWPLYAPHRVENLSGVCVSLSMEYQSWASRMRTGTLYTHAVLRDRGVVPRHTDTLGGLALMVRWGASLVLRRMRLLKSKIAQIERSFVPDPTHGSRPI